MVIRHPIILVVVAVGPVHLPTATVQLPITLSSSNTWKGGSPTCSDWHIARLNLDKGALAQRCQGSQRHYTGRIHLHCSACSHTIQRLHSWRIDFAYDVLPAFDTTAEGRFHSYTYSSALRTMLFDTLVTSGGAHNFTNGPAFQFRDFVIT